MPDWLSLYGQYILFGIIILSFGSLLLQQYLANRASTYVGTATVVSHRMEPAKVHGKYVSSWNYLVTFRLSDGEELELSAGEQEYYILTDGMTGTLHWQGGDFREFDTND